MTSPDLDAISVLRTGDTRRPAIGRAVRAALLATAAFEGFTVATKQIRPIYDHVPWAACSHRIRRPRQRLMPCQLGSVA